MNSKRIISGLLALSLVFGGALMPNGALKNIAAVSASAETVKYGDFICDVLDDGTAEISRYMGSDSEVEIPAEIEGATVTGIGAGAFSGCKKLVNVIIPDGVNSIGSAAFSQCSALKEVVIPDGVVEINDATFSYCSSLESVTLSKDLETIGSVAFSGCTVLKEIVMPDSVTSIGMASFNGCTSLANVVLSNNLETIGDASFYRCWALSEIVIPDGITSIGESTFANCKKIKNIVIPDGVESIGDEAFAECAGLESVTLSKNLTTIGVGAFEGCSALESITLPENLKNIGQSAFGSCMLIKSVVIPDGAETIGSGAFSWCNGLESITIPKSVTEIGEDMVTYYDASARKTVPADNVTIICYTNSAAHKYASENKLKFELLDAAKPTYPTNIKVDYSEEYHQIRFTWDKVENAQQYGIAVYLAGKWRIQTQKIPASTTSYTTPKNLTPGKSYKVAIAAKVDGKWDTANAIKNAVTVTVK